MADTFTDDDYYKACVAGFTFAGTASGLIAGSFGTPASGPLSLIAGYKAGAAWGLAAGFLLCPALAPRVKKKIEKDLPLDDFAMHNALGAMSKYAGVHNSSDALKLLAVVRAAPKRKMAATPIKSPRATAQIILSAMA